MIYVNSTLLNPPSQGTSLEALPALLLSSGDIVVCVCVCIEFAYCSLNKNMHRQGGEHPC